MRFDKLELPDDSPQAAPTSTASETPNDERQWLQQADTHRRNGHYENALRFYSRALEIEKSLVVAWVGQVQMLVQLGEYPQADLWSRKALELFPSHGELLAGRAQAVCRMGDMKQAYSLNDGAMQQRGDSAYCWQVRGEMMIADRQSTDRHCFDRAQVTSPDWLVPLETSLIYLYYRTPSKALQRAQIAVSSAATAPFAWLVLGRCQQELGFTDSARQSYERCLELCPRHDDASNRLAELGRGSLIATVRRWLGRA